MQYFTSVVQYFVLVGNPKWLVIIAGHNSVAGDPARYKIRVVPKLRVAVLKLMTWLEEYFGYFKEAEIFGHIFNDFRRLRGFLQGFVVNLQSGMGAKWLLIKKYSTDHSIYR